MRWRNHKVAADTSAAPETFALPQSPRAWHGHVWRLTWPVILANLTIPLVGVADVFVMGRLPDPAYIGAVAMGAAMFSAVYWLFGFLRMGTTGLIAQAWGGAQLSELAGIAVRALAVAITLGGLIVALQWPLSALLFQIFGDASVKVATLAEVYYDIRVWGAPGLLVYLVCLGVLFGLQRMRETLYLSIGLNLTNLILDVVLVLVFDFGVAGVAVGTLISEWGAAAFGVWLALRALRQAGWLGAWPAHVWQRAAAVRLFDVSSNLILRTFFVQLPFFVGTVLATGLSDATLATHGVLMQLFFIMTYSLDGFAHTAESLTGYCYGARNAADLRRATVYCAIWASLFAFATGAAFLFGGDPFIHALTISPEVREMASEYLPWVALAPLFCVWAFLFDGIFIGTTHIREMRNAMMISALVWAAVLYVSYTALAYHAVWLAMNVFMLVRGILLLACYPRIEAAARA